MAYTEDTRPEDLDVLTDPVAADIVPIVDNPSGTPLTKKVTVQALVGYIVTTAGDILYATASRTLARLAKGTASQVLTMNSGGTAPEWQTPGGGGRARLSLPVTAAHLPDDSAGSAAAQIQKKTSSDGTDPQLFWVEALFDASTDEHIYYQFLMPDNYASAPVVDVYYKAASSTADTVAFGAQMAAVTSADETDLDANLLDSANGGTSTSPATAGWMDVVSITMTNADSVAANDFVILCVYRDISEDAAAGDLEVPLVVLRYTST